MILRDCREKKTNFQKNEQFGTIYKIVRILVQLHDVRAAHREGWRVQAP